MKRYPPALTGLLAVSLAVTGCGKPGARQAGGTFPSAGAPAGPTSIASTAGVQWSFPQRWPVQPERPMRVATYSVPAAAGDTEDAECAVFYFGPSQGGSVDDNIQRWIGQFQPVTASSRSTRQVNGMPVSLVQVDGNYTAPSGPMMQSQGIKQNFRLLGAIVQGPQGAVFFKLTGPRKTVESCAAEFDALVTSLRTE